MVAALGRNTALLRLVHVFVDVGFGAAFAAVGRLDAVERPLLRQLVEAVDAGQIRFEGGDRGERPAGAAFPLKDHWIHPT